MSRRQTFSSIDTDDGHNYIIHKTPIDCKTRLRNFFGLPKPIENDDESWSFLTLLCATSFIEDAIFYKSIVHKVSKTYLYVYRWYSSPLVQKLFVYGGFFDLYFSLNRHNS